MRRASNEVGAIAREQFRGAAAVGGMGLAVGGTAVAIGAASVVAAGAVVGLAAYGLKKALKWELLIFLNSVTSN